MAKATGTSARTIQRMLAAGAFPIPEMVSLNGAREKRWSVVDVARFTVASREAAAAAMRKAG